MSKTFQGDVAAMVTRCRSLAGRTCWPGAVPMAESRGTLYYQVSMRLKAASMTDIDLEERLSDVQEQPDGSVRFTSTQRCTWPDGVAEAETEYVIAPGSLTFTYRYNPPTTKLVKTKQLPAFHAGMERVVAKYLDGLTATSTNSIPV